MKTYPTKKMIKVAKAYVNKLDKAYSMLCEIESVQYSLLCDAFFIRYIELCMKTTPRMPASAIETYIHAMRRAITDLENR